MGKWKDFLRPFWFANLASFSLCYEIFNIICYYYTIV